MASLQTKFVAWVMVMHLGMTLQGMPGGGGFLPVQADGVARKWKWTICFCMYRGAMITIFFNNRFSVVQCLGRWELSLGDVDAAAERQSIVFF